MRSRVICLAGLLAIGASAAPIDQYNVVWNSPSQDEHGSLPLGNGDIGVNAWIEPDGSLRFYISKTDSWGDNGRLLKIGRVRVTLDPAPPVDSFRQELSLNEGTMNVRYGDGTALQLWVDANHPVVHVAISSPSPTIATAALDLWRTNRFELPSIECSDVMTDRSQPQNMHAPTLVEPDVVVTGLTDRVGWYHHNIKSVGPRMHAETQGMTGYPREDPLLHRTFGAILTAGHGNQLDDTHLQSASAKEHRFDIHVLTRHPATPAEWLAAVDELVASFAKTPFPQRREAHVQWWREFWERSWIRASSNAAATSPPSSFPENNHLLRIGVDQSGGNRFAGGMRNVQVPDTLAGSFTLEAEVKPVAGETGRIFDRIAPGGSD
ncbi:MAG: hypothetical protein KDM81_18085, partial [Verrucomicrobiae bacterium]|nr:hypothetical protein [Verrucomicrobiae bacterium]